MCVPNVGGVDGVELTETVDLGVMFHVGDKEDRRAGFPGMFEAADPEVFRWYLKNYGPDVNLFVDHSQIVQLECLRSGIWGNKSLWGRVLTHG